MLKPPVTIEALWEEWGKDAPIDQTEPQKALVKIPELHSKYLRIMTHHNLVIKKIQMQYNERKRVKMQYYAGELNNPDDLAQYNLEPLLKKPMRSEINIYIDSDNELNTILLKKVVHEEIVEFCKAVLKELNSRTFQIRDFMAWERFIGER